MTASIKFRAMKNIGPRTLQQLKTLNLGWGDGVMIGYTKYRKAVYASYAIQSGVVQGWASLVNECYDWGVPVLGVYVAPEYRGNGLAEELLHNVLHKGMRYIAGNTVRASPSRFAKYPEIFDKHGITLRIT